MTCVVTYPSTDGLFGGSMFDFATTARASMSVQRREAFRALGPLLTSARLVRLFQKIGMLAVSRPSTIAALEVAVDRMARPRAARASLDERLPSMRRVRDL